MRQRTIAVAESKEFMKRMVWCGAPRLPDGGVTFTVECGVRMLTWVGASRESLISPSSGLQINTV